MVAGLNDAHYVRAITELGDTRSVVASCDIYSQNGMLLVASGIRVTSDLFDRLVRHKLLPALDKALSIDGMLNSRSILDDLQSLIEQNEKLGNVAHVINRGNSFRQIVGDIHLPTPLAFKLTVAKEKFPRVYQHSLLLLIISVYLARCEGMKLQEEEWVALAALFHDIGLLHIDPQLLEPSHVMTAAERRHLYAHPLTAYLLLCEFSELPRPIANAVLEHHERMDGSGYPRGLAGEKISRYGQILAVAELAAKAFDSDHPKIPWRKLDVMLKLNSRRYGLGLIGHLNIFRDKQDGESPVQQDPQRMVEQVRLIAKLFDSFNSRLETACNAEVVDFVQARLAELRLSLFSAGFDPRDPEILIQMFEDDPESMAEYAPVLDEAVWQFRSLLQEISRQWPGDADPSSGGKAECAWLGEMRLLLCSITDQA